jgi:hypothetical protein
MSKEVASVPRPLRRLVRFAALARCDVVLVADAFLLADVFLAADVFADRRVDAGMCALLAGWLA